MAKKKEEPKTQRPEGRLVPKEIKIKLTIQQCAQRSESAAKLSREKTDLRKEFEEEEKAWKQKRAEYKNKLKSLEDQADKLLAEVEMKSAIVTENVVLHLNHDQGCAEYWYQPPGGEWGIVDTRALEDGERQLSMVKEQVDSMPETGQEVHA